MHKCCKWSSNLWTDLKLVRPHDGVIQWNTSIHKTSLGMALSCGVMKLQNLQYAHHIKWIWHTR